MQVLCSYECGNYLYFVFFRCTHCDITEWSIIHMLLIKIIWFTQYLWISLLDGFCFISIQGHSRYWSDSCGEGYKVFIFLFSLLQDFDQVVINFVQGGTSSLNQISLRQLLSTLALASALQFSLIEHILMFNNYMYTN